MHLISAVQRGSPSYEQSIRPAADANPDSPQTCVFRSSRSKRVYNDCAQTEPDSAQEVAVIAVIFEVWPADGHTQEYLDIAASLRPLLDDIDGFISIERSESLSEPGKILSLSFWRDEQAIQEWRQRDMHRAAQAKGRASVFRDYRLRVAAVARDYGMFRRQDVPHDSRTFHG
jgi:heme-degrading monooxygenase HmoA